MKYNFDIATLSYIVSELNNDDIDMLIKNIKKINNIMSALIVNEQLTNINEGYCGFTYPDDIKVKCQPKLNLSSKYFIGKLK